jgi:hypothetical protein
MVDPPSRNNAMVSRSDGIDEEVEELAGAPDDHADGDFARGDAVVTRVHDARVALEGRRCGRGDRCTHSLSAPAA